MKKTTKFDIHCHILPWLDDGAGSVEETLEMARMAAEQGILGVVATPHYSARFQKGTPGIIRSYCSRLEAEFQKRVHKDFRIFPGQEILYSDEVPDKLKRGQVLPLADSDYVLPEFMPDVRYSYLFGAVRRIIADGYRPVLAHVERYETLREKGRVEELKEMGACIQMNYRGIGGRWYDETTRWCHLQLKKQNVHFLGTDMHNTRSRSPDTLKAEIWMQKHLPDRYINEICSLNARSILKNKRI